jgi:tripartite ATP-independent transporter DctM subunit
MIERGYKPEHVVSIVAASTCLGILIPPAIFMIVIGTMTGTSVVGIFLGAIFPGLVSGVILLMTIYLQALRFGWPYDEKPNLKQVLISFKRALIALFIPIVIITGFRYGAFTATEAGAVCAFYAVIVAWVVYRNVTIKEMMEICLDTAVITVAMLFLFGCANIYQYFLAIIGAPDFFNVIFQNLSPTNFLILVSLITGVFGLVMEGLPAAVILLPVVFPIAMAKGINPIHLCVVLTLGCSVGLFLPPTGAGLLICLKLGKTELSRKFLVIYLPYVISIIVSLIIIILFPSLSLILPNSAGIK